MKQQMLQKTSLPPFKEKAEFVTLSGSHLTGTRAVQGDGGNVALLVQIQR